MIRIAARRWRSDKISLLAKSISVSVITDFLGSGKAMLLACLLEDARMNKAAVIIIEFGEVVCL